jgi:hypothetical protein
VLEPLRRGVGVRACELAVGLLLVLGASVRHGLLPASMGAAALALLPAAAIGLARADLPVLARACLFATFGLVSRPIEIPAVAGIALLAEAIGALSARTMTESRRRPYDVVFSAVAVFACIYLTRVGIQRGLDFEAMDWAAGSFDSTSVAPSRVGVCLAAKYAAACTLVSVALLRWVPREVAQGALRVMTAAMVLRLGTMTAILFAPHVSFWSRFHMLGELGPLVVIALLAPAGLALRAALSRKRVDDPHDAWAEAPTGG